MEFSIKKSELMRELNLLMGVVERKTTMPILGHFLVTAGSDGQIELLATDLELSLRTRCADKVKKSGAAAIPAHKLVDYVKLLPEAEISFKALENHYVQLRCGRANTRMVGMAGDNFPESPAVPAAAPARVPAGALARMIGKVIFAISNEETRYTLNGALMRLQPSALLLVATDGHRLSHVNNDKLGLEGVNTEIKSLVPRKALVELRKLIEEAPENSSLEFQQNETHLHFNVPVSNGSGRQLAVRQMTGQFPNYEAVLPKDNPHSCPLPVEELAGSLRRVAQFADERSHGVKFKLEKGHLTLTSSTVESGEADEEMEVSYEGEAMNIGFNAQYLLEFLDVAGCEQVLLELKDEQSAGQFRPLNSSDDQARYVVMPMRI